MGAGSSIVILEFIFQSIFQSLQTKLSLRVNDIQAFSWVGALDEMVD